MSKRRNKSKKVQPPKIIYGTRSPCSRRSGSRCIPCPDIKDYRECTDLFKKYKHAASEEEELRYRMDFTRQCASDCLDNGHYKRMEILYNRLDKNVRDVYSNDFKDTSKHLVNIKLLNISETHDFFQYKSQETLDILLDDINHYITDDVRAYGHTYIVWYYSKVVHVLSLLLGIVKDSIELYFEDNINKIESIIDKLSTFIAVNHLSQRIQRMKPKQPLKTKKKSKKKKKEVEEILYIDDDKEDEYEDVDEKEMDTIKELNKYDDIFSDNFISEYQKMFVVVEKRLSIFNLKSNRLRGKFSEFKQVCRDLMMYNFNAKVDRVSIIDDYDIVIRKKTTLIFSNELVLYFALLYYIYDDVYNVTSTPFFKMYLELFDAERDRKENNRYTRIFTTMFIAMRNIMSHRIGVQNNAEFFLRNGMRDLYDISNAIIHIDDFFTHIDLTTLNPDDTKKYISARDGEAFLRELLSALKTASLHIINDPIYTREPYFVFDDVNLVNIASSILTLSDHVVYMYPFTK